MVVPIPTGFPVEWLTFDAVAEVIHDGLDVLVEDVVRRIRDGVHLQAELLKAKKATDRRGEDGDVVAADVELGEVVQAAELWET
jgi:hypothetical protein